MKIGTDCHISTLPADVFPYDIAIGIQEIKKANDVTKEDDELAVTTFLLDAGPLTSTEENSLHPDIKSRCSATTPKRLLKASFTKGQTDKLMNERFILLDGPSSECSLKVISTI